MARLLIVDDSLTARAIIRRLISNSHELREATSGAEAIEAVAAEAFDAVLLDLLMPDMDGFETLKRIKARRPGLPVLIVSADIQESTKKRILEAGAAGLVTKPVRKENIEQAVQRALDQRLDSSL